MQCCLITASRRNSECQRIPWVALLKTKPTRQLPCADSECVSSHGALCSWCPYLSHSAQIQIFHNIPICDITSLNAKLLFIMQMIGLYFSHVPNVPTADVWFTVFILISTPSAVKLVMLKVMFVLCAITSTVSLYQQNQLKTSFIAILQMHHCKRPFIVYIHNENKTLCFCKINKTNRMSLSAI